MELKFSILIIIITYIFILPSGYSKSAEEWKSRIIYQILTDRFAFDTPSSANNCSDLYEYCGGTLKGIENNLDYITGLGANAIWISSIIENTDRGFHGYWPKNLYKINPYFGTEEDVHSLIEACHQRGVWIMLDLILNHMGYPEGCHWSGCPPEVAENFTGFVPFDSDEDYHDYCEIQDDDWDNDQYRVEHCRLAYLPDLNQTKPYVRNTLLGWVQNLTEYYGFDGYRIDFILGVNKEFWQEVSSAAGVFTLGEAFNGNPAKISAYQPSLDSLLDFPMYYTLKNIFTSKQTITQIKSRLEEEDTYFMDKNVLGGFLDNHDVQRFLSLTDDYALLKNALTYLLTARWIPVIYYGTEQGFAGGSDPKNREPLWTSNYKTDHEIYKYIESLTSLRSQFGENWIDEGLISLETEDDEFYSFARGSVIVALTNIGSGANLKKSFPVSGLFDEGQVFCNGFNESDKIRVEDDFITIELTDGLPKIYSECPDNEKAFFSAETSLALLVCTLFLCFLPNY